MTDVTRDLISAARALAADGKARRSLGTNCDGRGHSCPYRAAIDAMISRAENVAKMAEALRDAGGTIDQNSSTSPAPCAHAGGGA